MSSTSIRPTVIRTNRCHFGWPCRNGSAARWIVALLTCSLLLTGCGGPKLPDTIKVTGQITFDGGPCPGPGTIYFNPIEAAAGFPMRPATAEFGTDGKFSAMSFEDDDGVMPGKYQIRVDCWETPPNLEGKPVKSFLPEKYQNGETSGYELQLKPGDPPASLKFDIVRK